MYILPINAYVGKERIHCFSVVRPVAMTQMQLSQWSGATEIQNNSSLLVIRHSSCVILDFQLETEGFDAGLCSIGTFWITRHRRSS